MGNKVPCEKNMGDDLRCCKCRKVLPPCKSFDDLYKDTIHGRYVYVYNGGEYYRPVGHDNMYECHYCFYKPIRHQEEMRREEERRRQEERQRREEEEERSRREEERKRREEEEEWRRREEERKRREEEERRRREEERKKKEEEQRREEARQRREEEERRRREEERQRTEEERRRREEERKRREEEERRRREEERKRREEEERRRREEERKRREEERRRREEERKKKEEEQRREEARQRREEERRRREEERKRIEEQRREEARQRKEEERRRRQEERKRREEEERRRREEERKRREEEERRRREEERKRREEEERRRREEERKKKEEEQRREEARQRREEERRRRKEERKMREEEERRRREEERKKKEEEWRREEERKMREEEERRRREEERKKKEEERRREDTRQREEERRRRKEDRQRREEDQRREEERERREERQRREEERRDRAEQRGGDEKRKRVEEKRDRGQMRRGDEKRRREEEEERVEELNQRLQESLQRVTEQQEKLSSIVSEQYESHSNVLIKHLGQFEANDDSGRDELLEILSLKCSFLLPNLSVSQLTDDQLGEILSVLKHLLFDEWLKDLPSLSTLQHTQVFITELWTLSLETPEGVSLQNISSQVQSLVESISQSACNVFENFLLTQALYLNLMHLLTGGSDTDAVLIAKRWTEGELSSEHLFPVEFLGSLTSSLQTVVERASMFILKMEIQCLKLLLSTLTHLNGEETHSESAEMLLRLVQINQWTPTEAVALLKALSQKYTEDVSITEVLTLVRVYDIPPEWTDESGRSLIQAVDSAGSERFHQDFKQTLRSKDESSLEAALAELKTSRNLDDSVIDRIKNITTGVLRYSENAPIDAPFMKDSFTRVTSNAENTQNALSQLCKAVYDTKGWWPTVPQMLRWCVLVLTGKTGVPQLVGIKEDPCVTAMFAATQVCMGNKLDIVLSYDSSENTKEWSDFYKHFGISVNTNMRETIESSRGVYEADIVYGTMDDFVSDYFHHAFEAMTTGNRPLCRGFIIEEQSLSTSHNLELLRLRNSDSLVFAAEVLQTLMGKFHSEDTELRRKFIKAIFQVLHTNLNKNNKIISISKKITGKRLPSSKIFALTFLKNLLKVVAEDTESEKNGTSPAGGWCLEILFGCLEQFHPSQEQMKELFQMVSNLGAQRLWSPVEALNLLEALTHHHHDKGCISIMKILHLIETYQVSSKWTDESNQSVLQLLDSHTTKKLIQHLEKSIRDEKTKSIDTLFDELQEMKDIDEQTLSKSYSVVTHVINLITTGKIKKHKDVKRARNLSHSTDTEDLQEVLAVLCNAVYLHKAERKWWPRATQMISWCLLALSDSGKLLEMGTGEGKSCVIAMFAALRALRGEKVDVVSSSSVLCQRDAEEWTNFYNFFHITADTNTNKAEDEDRKECYQKDVVYGTIEAFAADHLRQIFEMKDVRPHRNFQCIVIDEVDSLLLDQGVQLTYLSIPMVSMQHLNIILAMIWSQVTQYGFLSTGRQTFVHSPPVSFFKAIFDSIDTDETEIKGPMDILRIAEETNTVPEGSAENICKKGKDELPRTLKSVSQDAVVDFFKDMEDYVHYGFTVYTLDDKGLLCLRKRSPNNSQDIPELTFLVLEDGLCCALYDTEEILIKPIAELISAKIQYTPCENNIEDKISIPGFLKNLIEKKLSVWVQNAFLAKQLQEGREYVVENDNVCPVDFRSTGIVELNKKWGDGLQQFVEIKHQIKLSTMSTVTNYISNISLFEKYHGKIYGTTGTLGSKADILFLQELNPNLSFCNIPTFNRKKLFEVKGTLTTSAEEWKSEIKRVVMTQIHPNSYRGGRAALVICETINKAKEIYEELKSIKELKSIPGEIILYCRSDRDSLSKIDKELLPGDVIVATNLAGRGTDIKVSQQVNHNGGLFVILSFLSDNRRVELQAFGRTARKGKPGSAQVVISTEHLQQSFRTVSSLEEAKSIRDRFAADKIKHMMNEVAELNLREDLPSSKIFALTFLKNLLKVVAEDTESEKNGTSPAGGWCLEILFGCLEQFHPSQEQMKELFQMVSNLGAQRLWSPVEALNLLEALTHHHHDKGCISIMKILHLIETYQVSSKWTDESNQSVLQLLDSHTTKKLIQHLEKSVRDEKTKSIDTLFDELQEMKDTDEQTLSKSYSVVTHVINLITTGEIKKHKDVKRARNRSHSTDTEDLQEVLAVLCNAVYLHKAERKWWPRATQMISWCLLALSDSGKLLEMGTGEGKSCVIAMFAALRALRGEKVDVVSSSSVLCQRDAEEWTNFYNFFHITADTNTNKAEDEDRKECYQKDVVYGTIEAFAADHLRQIFEMKDVRPHRNFQCIVIDEVDSLLLDQGVQLTYLSIPMVSMQHLNIILAMIWSQVTQYGFLSTGRQTFVHSPPVSFFKAIFDSIDTDETEIKGPMDILRIAEETNTVPEGSAENICKKGKDELPRTLKSVSQDAVVDFFKDMEDYVHYGFTVYTLDDKGLLCLRKRSPNNSQDIPELTFLVLENGLCCALYDTEEILIKPIAELISAKIQYTPCENNIEDKISIPGFLKNLIEKKLSVWVQNAFLAKQLQEGREYVVENDNVCPVDFRSTGIVELNKKWGDGLQQFVEIKHQIKLSTMSTVTNYISNISLFEKYHGKIYGTTGTLGSKADILFLQELNPNLSFCNIPTFNRKKLFEVKGTLTTSAEEWKSEIKRVVMTQIHPNSYRGGRAALVICETINKAKEIYEELKSIKELKSIPGEIILYCRSDRDSLSKIDKELLPGDVIVATNLAGRGTDIKVSQQVNHNGGLFVILSFLSDNRRVELQAFGRTARKGKPGSAQVVISTEHLQQSFRTVSSLEEAKSIRDRFAADKIKHMMNEVAELNLREDLFSEYLKTLQDIHKHITDDDEKRAVVAIMNEFWGIWLQTKSDEIDQLKTNELQKSLKADLSSAKSQSQSQTSPCSSIYHYIKFGNIALDEKRWDASIRLFEKAMKQDESWAAIAFYSHAYCTVKQKNADYLTKARDDLTKAQESLKYLSEEIIVCLQFVKMSSANSADSNQNSTNSDQSSLEKQLTTKCRILSCFDKNISEAIQKLNDIKERGKDAMVNKSPIFFLVSNTDEGLEEEAYNLYHQGLKYIFSVEEEPRFPWGALLVVFLGVLQIVGGVFLITFTYGTLAEVGMELISEGIKDCIHGIESMVKGDFSWKSWAINKAISICVSLVAFGVGKLIAKGFKSCKMSIKGFGKELKSMPQFISRQARDGLTTVANTNIKHAVQHVAKKMVEETIAYGLGKAEQALLNKILNTIKDKVKEGIVDKVKSNMEQEHLATLVDLIILSHLKDKKQLHDLLEDEHRKSELLAIFRKLSSTAVKPFYKDLGWQNKLNSSFSTVIDKAKKEPSGKTQIILNTIKVVHMGALATDAVSSALTLTSKFFSNFHEQLNIFKEENGLPEKVKVDELSPSDTEMLKKVKHDLANIISALLADALVEVFHQKFSSHIVSHVQGKVNGVICNYVRTKMNSDQTEQLIRAGQNNRYIAYMPVDRDSRNELVGDAGRHSLSHAEKIIDSMTAGTILDVKVLSETTGTTVVILTPDSHGGLTKMHELSPGTEPASQTVTLIYTPKCDQYPDGHYDVRINDQTVSIVSEHKSCLFHALARGMKPEASEREIALEASRLRTLEADTLLRNPGEWDTFVQRKDWTEAIRGGDWFMLAGGSPRKILKDNAKRKNIIKENTTILEEEVGKVEFYKDWKTYAIHNKGIGQFINADHQPPVKSILEATKLNQNSKLAEAMLEVATNSSPLDQSLVPDVHTYHGLELPTVYVPKEVHYEFPSTRSPAFRACLATAISKDDVEGAFKLMILGAMPRCELKKDKDYKNFQDGQMSKTRLNTFKNSFPHHSTKVVKTWFSSLQDKGVMTDTHLTNITAWINRRGYDDENDPYRNQVNKLL